MTQFEETKERQKIEQDNIIYILNEEEKTADIINNNFACGDIYIPRSIKYEGDEFLVLNILQSSFEESNISSIQFPPDSELRIIGKNAFRLSSLEKITIPRHVTKICEGSFSLCEYLRTFKFHPESELQKIEKNVFKKSKLQIINIPSNVFELKDGWCNSFNLGGVTLNSNNKHFKNYEDKLILGKSDIKSDTFDVVVYAQKRIKRITIPPYIKKIAPFSFSNCSYLQKIEFAPDSKLQIIGKSAFSYTKIVSFKIPASVCILEDGWFDFSEIDRIENENVTIDPNNKHFKNYEDKLILGKSDIKSDIFDVVVYAQPNISTVTIPPYIKRIASRSFSYTSIDNIKIPSNVSEIGKFALPLNQIVEFSPDSKLQVIKNGAFLCSKDCFVIPPNVYQLKHIFFPPNLMHMKIMPNNKHFKNYKDKLILGKSDTKSDIFDVVVFAQRDIKSVTIPPNIKIIAEKAFSKSRIESVEIPSHVTQIRDYAFSSCHQLKHVKFAPDSELQTIGCFAFRKSSIESIFITSHVTTICECAFNKCYELKKVEFASDSNLQKIGNMAFCNDKFERITIPSHTKIIGEKAFSHCSLKRCKFQSGSELRIIGNEAFEQTLLEKISIPSSVTMIGLYAFSKCSKLKKVTIKPNSNLQVIKPLAFNDSHITSLFIPKNVKKIYRLAFGSCPNLVNIEFAKDSELQTIEKFVFSSTPIESITFPSKLNNLIENWCCGISKLNQVKIMQDNKNFIVFDEKLIFGKSKIESDDFDVLDFACRGIEKVEIPSNIKIISSFSFTDTKIKEIFIPSQITDIHSSAFACTPIEKVEFAPDSQLQVINKATFRDSNIKQLLIPRNVRKICNFAFGSCNSLEKIEFTSDSELQKIEKDIFKQSTIESFVIPSKLTELDDGWCNGASKLKKVTIMPNNNKFMEYGDDLILGKSDILSDVFDVLVFANRNIRNLIIPPNIKKIGPYSLSYLKIRKIFIPSNITHICKGAFSLCSNLNCIEIPENSQIQSIGKYAFKESLIQSLCIPPHVKHVQYKVLLDSYFLNIVEISDNSELEEFNPLPLAFTNCAIMCPKRLSYLFDEYL